jgi:hypothetical protein
MKFAPEFIYKSITDLNPGYMVADPASPGHIAIVGSGKVPTLIALLPNGPPQEMTHENVVSVIQYRGETVIEVSLLGAREITGDDLLSLRNKRVAYVMLEGQDRYLPFVSIGARAGLLNLSTFKIRPPNDPLKADVALPSFRIGVQEPGMPVIWVYESPDFEAAHK